MSDNNCIVDGLNEIVDSLDEIIVYWMFQHRLILSESEEKLKNSPSGWRYSQDELRELSMQQWKDFSDKWANICNWSY